MTMDSIYEELATPQPSPWALNLVGPTKSLEVVVMVQPEIGHLSQSLYCCNVTTMTKGQVGEEIMYVDYTSKS